MHTLRRAAFALLPLVFVACTDQQPADPDLADGPLFNNGAVVFRGDFGCAVIDGEGNWFPDNYLEPPDFPALFCGTEVATFSKNGNASLTVRASGVPNPTGKTVHWGPYNPGQDWADSYLPDITEPPYPCFVLGTDRDLDNPLFTLHWKAWVTPSGEATLSCQYSKKWEFQWPSP
jgi:hypothetical protein